MEYKITLELLKIVKENNINEVDLFLYPLSNLAVITHKWKPSKEININLTNKKINDLYNLIYLFDDLKKLYIWVIE